MNSKINIIEKKNLLDNNHRYLKRILFKNSLEKLTYLTNRFSSFLGNEEEKFIYLNTDGLNFKDLHPRFQEIMKKEFLNFYSK